MAENGSALQALALSEELTPDERWKLGLSSSSSSERSPDLPQGGQFDPYAGGAGWSPWASNAAGTAIGALGQFGGIPGPVTSIAGGVAKSALGDEGINAHTLANSGIGILAGMTGLGIPLSVAKIASKLAGEELDVSNLIGEWTGSYGLRSPQSLNLELFDKESDSAFQGLNQQTLAEIARQEAENRAEHEARNQNEILAAQDAAMNERAARNSPLTELQQMFGGGSDSSFSYGGLDTGKGSGFDSGSWGSSTSSDTPTESSPEKKGGLLRKRHGTKR